MAEAASPPEVSLTECFLWDLLPGHKSLTAYREGNYATAAAWLAFDAVTLALPVTRLGMVVGRGGWAAVEAGAFTRTAEQGAGVTVTSSPGNTFMAALNAVGRFIPTAARIGENFKLAAGGGSALQGVGAGAELTALGAAGNTAITAVGPDVTMLLQTVPASQDAQRQQLEVEAKAKKGTLHDLRTETAQQAAYCNASPALKDMILPGFQKQFHYTPICP